MCVRARVCVCVCVGGRWFVRVCVCELWLCAYLRARVCECVYMSVFVVSVGACM